MRRWIKDHVWSIVLVLLVLLLLDMTVGAWLRHNTKECLKLFYRPGGEAIAEIKGLASSGAGIRGKRIYLVTTESGAQWTLHVHMIFQVTPLQIGPGGWITGIDSWLISEAPEYTEG